MPWRGRGLLGCESDVLSTVLGGDHAEEEIQQWKAEVEWGREEKASPSSNTPPFALCDQHEWKDNVKLHLLPKRL
uniref:Uncharacterized protein n=1 Tax=Knipowitschia caucasica TaxID=637954 RepID=A0AAV2LG53_KNICA